MHLKFVVRLIGLFSLLVPIIIFTEEKIKMKRFLAVLVFTASMFVAIAAMAETTLVGISYNASIMQNEIHKINPDTGQKSVILSFEFDSVSWISGTFCVDSQNDLAYAVSSNDTLYQFNLTTGDYTTTSLSLDNYMQAVAIGKDNSLVAINYNNSTMQNEIHKINPDTGQKSVILSFEFDSVSWISGTFCVDSQNDLAYAVSSNDTLYQFNLTTGDIPPHHLTSICRPLLWGKAVLIILQYTLL